MLEGGVGVTMHTKGCNCSNSEHTICSFHMHSWRKKSTLAHSHSLFTCEVWCALATSTTLAQWVCQHHWMTLLNIYRVHCVREHYLLHLAWWSVVGWLAISCNYQPSWSRNKGSASRLQKNPRSPSSDGIPPEHGVLGFVVSLLPTGLTGGRTGQPVCVEALLLIDRCDPHVLMLVC